MSLTEVITTIIQVTETMVTMVTTIITTQEGKSFFFYDCVYKCLTHLPV